MCNCLTFQIKLIIYIKWHRQYIDAIFFCFFLRNPRIAVRYNRCFFHAVTYSFSLSKSVTSIITNFTSYRKQFWELSPKKILLIQPVSFSSGYNWLMFLRNFAGIDIIFAL